MYYFLVYHQLGLRVHPVSRLHARADPPAFANSTSIARTLADRLLANLASTDLPTRELGMQSPKASIISCFATSCHSINMDDMSPTSTAIFMFGESPNGTALVVGALAKFPFDLRLNSPSDNMLLSVERAGRLGSITRLTVVQDSSIFSQQQQLATYIRQRGYATPDFYAESYLYEPSTGYKLRIKAYPAKSMTIFRKPRNPAFSQLGSMNLVAG